MYNKDKKYGRKHNLYGIQAQVSPTQVRIRGESREEFESAFRAFKSLVQKEKIISLYKEKQSYEKPSDKKRRKRKESCERRLAFAAKQRLMASGEWDKRMRKKQEQKNDRQQQRRQQQNEDKT